MPNITENHPTLNKYIQFKTQYDVNLLKSELAIAMSLDWQDHFNKKDYNGSWQSISLKSASGKEADIFANYGVDSYQETPLLKKLPYIKSIIDSWLCPKESIRLLALHPGAEIKPHQDRGCNYANGMFRLHIPIQTNAHVDFRVSDERLVLEEGSSWYIDFDQTHAITNKGETIRVHLVIDGLRNAWTDELFAAYDYDIAQEAQPQQMDKENTLKVIAELERLGTPISKQLIAELKKTADG